MYGIEYSWQVRRTASTDLGDNFGQLVDKGLQVVVDDLNFPDELVRAAEGRLAAMGDHNKRDVAQDSCGDNTPNIDILARSNHRLREQQTDHFRKKIKEKNKELLQVDYKILRLQLEVNKGASAIRSLVKTRLEMQKEVDSNHLWISSARLLPVDVIILIIQYVIATGFYLATPMKLSHVCSSWRKAALTCTSLWNELKIKSMPTDGYRVHEVHRNPSIRWLINTWFGRSTPMAPLSFHLSLNFEEANSDVGKSVAEGILPFADRVSKIYLSFDASYARDVWDSRGLEIMAPFLTLPSGTFPRLKELKLSDYVPRRFKDRPAEEVIPKITVFDQSPLLHLSLCPQYWLFRAGSPTLFLPWSGITHLLIGEAIPLSAFVVIILQCRELQQVIASKVDANPMDAVVVPVGEPITFSSLTDWELNICTHPQREIMENVLHKIRLPVVETLSLVSNSPYTISALPFEALIPVVTELETFIYPPLRRLLLSCWNIALIDLVDLLNACPVLEELSLYLASLDPVLILESLSDIKLSHLVSFEFAFKAPGQGEVEPVDKNEELKAVLAAYSRLIAWLRSATTPAESQQSSLSKLILCITDTSQDDDYRRDEPKLKPYLKDIIKRDVGENLGIQLAVILMHYGCFSGLDPRSFTISSSGFADIRHALLHRKETTYTVYQIMMVTKRSQYCPPPRQLQDKMIIIRPRILISASLILLALLLVSATPIPSPPVVSGALSDAPALRNSDIVPQLQAPSVVKLLARGNGASTPVSSTVSHPDGPSIETGGDSPVVRDLKQLTQEMQKMPVSEEAMLTTLKEVENLIPKLEEKDFTVSSDVFLAIGAVKFTVAAFKSKRQAAIEAIEACEAAALAKKLPRDGCFSKTNEDIRNSIQGLLEGNPKSTDSLSMAHFLCKQKIQLRRLAEEISYLRLAKQREMRTGLEEGYNAFNAKMEGWRLRSRARFGDPREVRLKELEKWKMLNSLVEEPR
ncbi:hypothetical protein H0H93_004191 [Arthromyces matolae]|nr:hypothetical protein H0H93_004191 [Arthromyces matolae]